jgi:3-phenylpropionate/cinnamic acid dioxygenase small subunit
VSRRPDTVAAVRTSEPSAQHISDEQAIANLLYTYAERVDAGDFDGVSALFAHAAFRTSRYDSGDGPRGSAVGDLMRSTVITYPEGAEYGTPRTKHVTTNLIVELDGDTASTRSGYTVLQSTDNGVIGVIITGRYHDRFERVDGQWRFADRLVFMDLFGDLSKHLRGFRTP